MANTVINTPELLNLDSTTGATVLAKGTISERPTTNAINGALRFNTDTNKTEYYDGTGWYEIVDEYANGYDGIPTNYFDTKLYTGNGATQSIGGYINGSASFSGNGYISGLPTVQNTSGEFSVSMWFNTTVNPSVQHTMLGGIKEQGTNDSVFALKMLNDGYSKLYLRGTDGTLHILADTVDAADGNWHHLVATVSSSSGVFYVDGQQVDSATISNNITVDNLLIGAENNRATLSPTNYFDGSIDQVRIYNTALSSADVTALYGETAATATTAAFPSGQTAVATYTMDTSANGLLNTQDLSTVNYPAGAGCLALYEMNGNSNDTSGTYNGTPTNITYEGGAFDQAAVFNGSSSYIDTNGNPLKTGAFSVSFWTKLNAYGTSPAFVSTANNSGSQGFEIRQNSSNNKLDFYFGAGSVFTDSNSALPLNEWMHIACTYDSTTLKIYINGVQQTSTATGTLASVNNNIYIGKAYNYSRYINGSIDQLRLFNTALTQSQVTTLARGIATSYSGAATNVNFNGHLDFQPDFVWIKNRDNAYNHYLYDSIRGPKNVLISDSTIQNTVQTNGLSSFEANGFFLEGNRLNVNENNSDIVAWNWKAGGTAVTNNDGTIASQVSANKDSGFSIVTMNNASVSTVGHGLSQAPELIIWKSLTSNTNYWQVLAQAANGGNGHLGRLALQRSDAFLTVSSVWNNTQPTSTVFTLGASCTGSGVAYCFHSVAGYSKIGSYTGTGAAGKSVTTGFEPSWLMVKRTNGTGDWNIWDARRGSQSIVWANGSNAEVTNSVYEIEFVSTGFVINATASFANGSGDLYIYMAFA